MSRLSLGFPCHRVYYLNLNKQYSRWQQIERCHELEVTFFKLRALVLLKAKKKTISFENCRSDAHLPRHARGRSRRTWFIAAHCLDMNVSRKSLTMFLKDIQLHVPPHHWCNFTLCQKGLQLELTTSLRQWIAIPRCSFNLWSTFLQLH